MKDIDKLMLNWKHFPLGDIGETTLPPLHPILIEKDRLDPDLVLKVLDEALYMTIEEGKKFSDHMEYRERIIEGGEVKSSYKNETNNPQGVYDWVNDKVEDKGGIERFNGKIGIE